MTARPSFGRSTTFASQGGDVHSAGSACFTSYMKYMPIVRFAPASSIAKTEGWPSVGIRSAVWKPASRSICIISRQPSSMPLFSAAIEGWRIQACSRAIDSAWRRSSSR
jgi:hypothetical protein